MLEYTVEGWGGHSCVRLVQRKGVGSLSIHYPGFPIRCQIIVEYPVRCQWFPEIRYRPLPTTLGAVWYSLEACTTIELGAK